MSAAVPKLERALVWDASGHLADAAVAALVDGELALLPDDAVQHAERCEACVERVGRAALFALEVAEALDVDLAFALAEDADALQAERAAPQYALALAPPLTPPLTIVAQAAASEPVSSRPAYGRAASLAPPAPLPVPAVVAALVVALVAGSPWLASLRSGSLAETLAQLASLLSYGIAAARAPGVAELAWFAAALLGLAGVGVARLAARPERQMIEGMR